MTATAELSEAMTDSVEVPLTTTAMTAEPDDCAPLASITIEAGMTTGSGSIMTMDDGDADDEVFMVALGDRPGGVVPTDGAGTRRAAVGGGFGGAASGSSVAGVVAASASGRTGLCAVGVHGGLGSIDGPGSYGGFRVGADPLRGSEFVLALGSGQHVESGGGPGRRWQVWGQGDIQTFRGSPSTVSGYDEELLTGYVGVDTRVTERSLAGVAVARSRGSGNRRAGGSRGSLATSVTAVHPFLRWSDGATSVWATAGTGWGEAENVRRGGRVGTSGLGLRLSLVEFGVRADAAWTELRTEASGESVDGQTAAVNQARVGAEVPAWSDWAD